MVFGDSGERSGFRGGVVNSMNNAIGFGGMRWLLLIVLNAYTESVVGFRKVVNNFFINI